MDLLYVSAGRLGHAGAVDLKRVEGIQKELRTPRNWWDLVLVEF